MRLTASTTVIEHKGRAYDAVQISCEAPDFVCYVLYDADGHQPDIASIIGDRPVFQLWRIGDDLRTRRLAGAEYDVDDECESIIAGRWRFVAPSAAPVDAPALSPESLKQRARAVLDARREWDRQRSAGAEDYDARAMAKAGKLIADEGPAVVALLLRALADQMKSAGTMSYAAAVPAATRKPASKPGRGGARKGAGRPPVADPLRSTGFRLPAALLARLDAVLDPGEDRSAFARAALESAIVERETLR